MNDFGCLFRLHLEDAALAAIFGLYLHVNAGAGALEHELFAVGINNQIPGQDFSVQRFLASEDDGWLVVGNLAVERVVGDFERVKCDCELDELAAHLCCQSSADGDADSLVAAE